METVYNPPWSDSALLLPIFHLGQVSTKKGLCITAMWLQLEDWLRFEVFAVWSLAPICISVTAGRDLLERTPRNSCWRSPTCYSSMWQYAELLSVKARAYWKVGKHSQRCVKKSGLLSAIENSSLYSLDIETIVFNMYSNVCRMIL